MENKVKTPQGDGNVILETATQVVVQLSDGSFTIVENKFKIGDLVRVRDNAEEFQSIYAHMREYVGQIGRIIGSKYESWVLVRFSNGAEYHYKTASLELAQENLANGTLVRIVRKVEEATMWINEMNPLIGQVGRVFCSRGSYRSPIYNVQFPGGEKWWFDGPCLEKVEDEFPVEIEGFSGRMVSTSTGFYIAIPSPPARSNWPWWTDAEQLSRELLGYYEDGGFPYCKTAWDALCLAYAASEKEGDILTVTLGGYVARIGRGAASFEVGCTTITKEQVNEIYEWINK